MPFSTSENCHQDMRLWLKVHVHFQCVPPMKSQLISGK